MTATPPAHAESIGGTRLDGRVALITGAGGQLGRRIAIALGERGANVALNHRGHDEQSIKDTRTRLAGLGAATCEVVADTARSAEVAGMFSKVEQQLGRPDIVVHTPGRVTKRQFAEITDEEFEASVEQNLRAAFYVLREAARRLPDGGRIVTLTTSITGVTTPLYGIYAGHKAATEHYVRALAKELGPRGITVNAVGPGPINSPFYFGVETAESFARAKQLSGARRLGEWDDIVPTIAFLCTPDAQWITAQTIRVNGGMTA